MDNSEFKSILSAEFSGINLSKGFRLAEADFYDYTGKTFAKCSTDYLTSQLQRIYGSDICKFVVENIQDNQYLEPFKEWYEIPSWYYEKFSFGGIINLSDSNIIYYLAGFMNSIVSNRIDLNSSLGFSAWYDILDSDSYSYFYVNKLSQQLNDNQLKMIALFLCYDYETDSYNLSPPEIEDDSVFAKFWYPLIV